ncbi:MAG: hypothetical protein AB1656_04920 [Candidatus Omnitrophota bacterium]
MNKKRSVRIPVTEQMLKELRQKARENDIDVTDATRIFWRDWITGKIHIGSHARYQPPVETA